MTRSNSNPSLVTSSLIFCIEPDNGEPAKLNMTSDPITKQRERNWTTEQREIYIEDISQKKDTVTLDTAGFQFFTSPTKHVSFDDDADIQRGYYPECIELIKEMTGASRVVLFNHTVRRRRPNQEIDVPAPVNQAHADQTTLSSITHVSRYCPENEVPELLKRHFQIINLWRPIINPAFDWPLGLCDYRSVDPHRDVFPCALFYPGYESETYLVKYSPEHKWKYVRGMKPEDFVLIKCFDSIQDGSVAVFTPHAAFKDPTTPEDAPSRESIEVRALVFYD
ncbi:hypothetical protein AMATHDRAFT_158041 [Amanita thiersii Skay4041]|uniref:Methyltransferase n=1 Tax=Amanita thiersii Skay4041 TaxID=703135 RepID=A0A2A9NBV2_9AGAR|nr:hypothetical protein AMATHDRAFT_158041 [Amanita thiersii Skay4041]